ncbi:MAG TPA: flavin reductase family protein [Pyrinomonadaceae bacterium]|nr:flavin reductase family protein [Pyrinomonadaceae bacterium]
MPISEDEFRSALSRFPSGVTVVTTKDAAGRFHGITVSAFSSVSLDPPLVLICIERAAYSHPVFIESGVFAVNFLSSEQSELSERFAAPLEDKFGGIDFTVGDLGLPLIAGCLANLECKVRNTGDGGDHTIFIGEVESATVSDGDPLLYFRSDYREIGAS